METIKDGRRRYLGWSLFSGAVILAVLAIFIVMAINLFVPKPPIDPCGHGALIHGPHGEVNWARPC